MARSWLRRLTAIAVAIAVLGGGPGAPVLDALIYHRDASEHRAPGTHVEADGTRLGHDDSCSLGWLRAQPPASPAPAPVLVRVAVRTASLTPRKPSFATADFSYSPYSRAPPPARA